jgi:hypothetical protein
VSHTVQINTFVCRHIATSRFSHFGGSWIKLKAIVQEAMGAGNVEPGYRDGVFLVSVPPEGFYSGVCQLTEGDELVGGYEARREGEEPRKFVALKYGQKMAAKAVDIIVYTSEVLAEDGSNEFPVDEGNVEIISINARATEGPEPLTPETLMANHFHVSGGTNTMMGDAVFMAKLAESYNYWKDKAMLTPKEDK